MPAPIVVGVSPNTGPQGGGTVCTVTGANFLSPPVFAVQFGSTTGFNLQLLNNTQLIITAPPETPPLSTVRVIAVNGQFSAPDPQGRDLFFYTATPPPQPPTVTGLSPNQGPTAGGTSVTVFGTGFLGGVTQIAFGTTLATSYNVLSDTQLRVTSPPHTPASTVDVRVTTTHGTSALTQSDAFFYVGAAAAPTVTSVTPNNGPAEGGTFVTVTGTGFDPISGNTAVLFGPNAAVAGTVGVSSPTLLTCVSPPGSGTVDVRVVTSGGGFSPLNPPADQFTYAAAIPAPTVTQVVPDSGTALGGDVVYVYGTNFDTTPGNTTVLFGSSSGVSIAVYDANTLGCYSPPGAGTVDVRVVTVHGGFSPITPADHFTYIGVHVTSVAPNTGTDAGGTAIEITGSGFDPTQYSTYVFIGDQIQANIVVLDAGHLFVTTTPQPPGQYRVVVYVNGVYSTENVLYTYTLQGPPVGGPPLTPCNLSHVFDAEQLAQQNTPGQANIQPDTILSFCDRMPAGRYVILRSANQTLPSYLAQTQSNFRGVAFFLGDSEDYLPNDQTPPMTQRSYGIQWAPDNSATARPWQKLQFMLQHDQPGPTLSTYQIAGSQTFHNAHRLAGGYFHIGQRALSAPAQTATAIAGIKNILDLDFVLIDISDGSWEALGASQAALTLFQHVQELYLRTRAGGGVPRTSAHTPTFAVVPATPTGSPHLLAGDGCFEPTVNGYSGPKTFLAPRMQAGDTNMQNVWQWARPENSSGTGMSRCEPVIDMRFSGAADATAQAATTRTQITTGGFTAHVYSGALFFDDFDHTGSALGPTPTAYWNYDLDLVPNLVDGAIVPSYYPDPMPIAQTDHDWAEIIDGVRVHFTIEFENWKTGHVTATNTPSWISVVDPGCVDLRHTLRTWVRMNGVLMTTSGFNSITFDRGLTSPHIQFSGVPVSGDDGLYPFLIAVRRGQNNFDLETSFTFVLQVVDPNRVFNFGSARTSSTGVPIPYPDIAASVAYAGSLHPTFPRAASIARIPGDWGTAADYCRGTPPVTKQTPGQIPPFPLPPRGTGSQGRTDVACGFNYLTDYVQAFLDGCGAAQNVGQPLQICATPQQTSEYIGFVFAVTAALSGFDTLYQSGTQAGLLSLDTATGIGQGHTIADLQNPAFTIDLGQSLLQVAWQYAAISNCAVQNYADRVKTAYLVFVSLAGIYPTSGPNPLPCGSGTTGPQPRGLATVGNNAVCFQAFYTGASGTPSPGQPGQPPTLPTGCQPELSICQALALATFPQADGSPLWDNSRNITLGGTAAQTIVEIAFAEANRPVPSPGMMLFAAQDGFPGSCLPGTPNAWGALQFCPSTWGCGVVAAGHPCITQDDAHCFANALDFARRHVVGSNAGEPGVARQAADFGNGVWGSFGDGTCPNGFGYPACNSPNPYCCYIPLVTTTAPCSPPAYDCGGSQTSLTDAQKVGQLLMVGYTTGTIGQATANLQAQHVGSVVLFGNGWTSSNLPGTTSQLQATARGANGGIGALISGNQEGGAYQAFTGAGFSTIPDALTQGQMTTTALAAQAATWAQQLLAVGINYDLAPVMDVTPGPGAGNASDPTGRTYGYDPNTVSTGANTFRAAVQGVGVATASKHFPGLGRISGNTDMTTVGITDAALTGPTDPNLFPFSTAIQSGASSIMVGNAYYPHVAETPTTPAFASHNVITGLLRTQLGYGGVVVSDDIGAAVPATTAYPDPGQRAVAFIRAGGDLILTVNPGDAAAMSAALLATMQADTTFAALVNSSLSRILALKAALGLGTQVSAGNDSSFLGCPVTGCTNPPSCTQFTPVCLSRDCDTHQILERNSGIDLAANCGTPIFATCPGIIQHIGDLGDGYGTQMLIACDNCITVNGQEPVYTRFGHMPAYRLGDLNLPSVNAHVLHGEQIGYIGTTGNSTGCHVHYEVMAGGVGSQFTVCPTGDAVPSRNPPLPSGPTTVGAGCISSICAGA